MIDPLRITELVLTGMLAGFSAGLLGIGGGALLTPLLYFFLKRWGVQTEWMFHIIFGTNLLVIIFFSLSSTWGHHRQRNVLWPVVAHLIIGSIPGALLGPFAASHISSEFLGLHLFSLFLIVASLRMIQTSIRKTSYEEKIDDYGILKLAGIGFIVGFVGSLLGIGGGAILIPIMVLFLGFPIKKMAGTSSANIVFLSIFGTVSYILNGIGVDGRPEHCFGFVWWLVAVPLIIGGIPAAGLGAYVNSRINARPLRIIFGVFLFVVGLKMFFS